MLIQSLEIVNFRSIKSGVLGFQELTALVGRNGAGKSSFLRALNLFYEGPSSITKEDFYARDLENPIQIKVAYLLSGEESAAFAGYVLDDVLVVNLRIQPTAGREGIQAFSSSYHGTASSHPPFDAIRALSSAVERKDACVALKETAGNLYDFEIETAWSRTSENLAAWERDHPAECHRVEDEGTFFKPPHSSNSPLAPYTELIFIPAVHQASEEGTESRNNATGRLVSLVVGSLSDSSNFVALSAEFREKYSSLVEQEKQNRLPALQSKLTSALQDLVADAEVDLDWIGADVSLSQPRTSVRLDDDGFTGAIESKGHGLQRLFIVSILQVAASESSTKNGLEISRNTRSRILAIEEPELYQHPNQARQFAKILMNISSSVSLMGKTQVLYTTHSPYFVGVERFDSIRLIRKVGDKSTAPLESKIFQAPLATVMEKVNTAHGHEEYSIDRFKAALKNIMDPSVNEGFFAQRVVLVEGAEDKAIVEAALRELRAWNWKDLALR